MLPESYKEATLETIGGGRLEEMFQRELKRVVTNIADLDTKPTSARKITIEMHFDPDEERKVASVAIKVTSKLVENRPSGASVFLAREGGGPLKVYSHDLQQEVMDMDSPAPIPMKRDGRGAAAKNDD